MSFSKRDFQLYALGSIVVIWIAYLIRSLLIPLFVTYFEKKKILENLKDINISSYQKKEDEETIQLKHEESLTINEILGSKLISPNYELRRRTNSKKLKKNDHDDCNDNNDNVIKGQQVQSISKPKPKSDSSYSSRFSKIHNIETPRNLNALISSSTKPKEKKKDLPEHNILNNIETDRNILFEQDLEYSRCLEEDIKKQQKQAELESYRNYLQEQISEEPDKNESGCITLICKVKYADVKTISTTKSIKRRFLISQQISSIFDFIESLELRPLYSPIELSFGFPAQKFTRQSCEENKRTLEELGLTQDSVIHVHYPEDN